jgi:hypothetical protein
MGWDELREMTQVHSVQNVEFERKAVAIWSLFSTELGQEVLEIIRLHTEAKTTLPSQAADGQAMSILMAVREGENNLYRWIYDMIQKGHPSHADQ